MEQPEEKTTGQLVREIYARADARRAAQPPFPTVEDILEYPDLIDFVEGEPSAEQKEAEIIGRLKQ